MSRSYKKTPACKDPARPWIKQQANKKIRSEVKQGIEISDGSEYKKHFESWDISDFTFIKTEEQAKEEYKKLTDKNSIDYNEYVLKAYPTEKDFMRWWITHYRSK